MKKQGVEKAKSRLRNAEEDLRAIETIQTLEEFEAAWLDLLTNLNTVWSVLQTSVLRDPRTRQWFGGKKAIRRKDELLAYFHQARNSDEHGIEQILARDPQSITIGTPGAGPMHLEELIIDGSHARIKFHPSSVDKSVHITPEQIRLLPVTDDRYGTVFKLPEIHLGQPIADTSVLALSRLALAYHQALVDEADKLAT
jgi:hypothetical protein